jgi:hypothetical protein
MSIPALIYGRTDSKAATLLYLMDPDGCSAKGFQWYCDDRNLHISVYDLSDHQIDPYGVGGKDNPGVGFNTKNDISFSLRIRPYKSNTRWVDWDGYLVYKQEAVPEQQDYGWIPKSLFEKYSEDQLDISTRDFPFILNTEGQTSGNSAETILPALGFYQDLYINSINPGLTYTPAIPVHIKSITSNSSPLSGTDGSSPENNYYGWEPWAGENTGVFFGPEAYVSPDFTEINSVFSGIIDTAHLSGGLIYPELSFPFHIASGSSWVNDYAAIDLAIKPLIKESIKTTNEDYQEYAYSGIRNLEYNNSFEVCLCSDIAYDKFLDIAEVLSSGNAGVHFESLGNWGRGCFAKEHEYKTTPTSSVTTIKHPRGIFSNYFIKKQKEWLAGWDSIASQNIPDTWNGSLGYLYNKSSEYLCDISIKNTPIALDKQLENPIQNNFYSLITNPRQDSIKNTYTSGNIDNLSDSAIIDILSGSPSLNYWNTKIQPPNWIQKCPAFIISFNNSIIINDFEIPHVSNLNNVLFKIGEETGRGSYGQVLYDTVTEEQSILDWSSWTALRWHELGRITAAHASSGYSIFNEEYSGVTTESIDLVTGNWGTFTTDLVKKLFRIQAYCPDYLFHGTLLHPLDIYNTEYTTKNRTSLLSRKANYSNIFDISSLSSGDPKVVHSVREHREGSSFLFVATNWFSGETTFSGQFNPSEYSIETSYQVYSLDVNTSAHGTRTLVDIIPSGQSFDINLTLDQYETTVYEFITNNRVLENTVFDYLKTNYTPIRYNYTTSNLKINDLAVCYSYNATSVGEFTTPLVGFRSAATQAIANNLPQWTKIRQNNTAVGWQLMNSWGMGFESVLETTNKYINNMFIPTADKTLFSKLYTVEVSDNDILEKEYPNVLYNSSFALRDISITELPSGWNVYSENKDISLAYNIPAVSAVVLNSESGKFKIGQDRTFDELYVNKLFASVYVKTNSSNVSFKLIVSIEDIFGRNTSKTAKLVSRSQEWTRLVLPIDINKKIYRINYTLISDCSGEVSICCPQLQENKLSSWSTSVVDFLPYLPSSQIGNCIYAVLNNNHRIPVYPISDENTFTTINIPTRISKISIPTDDQEYIGSQHFGRRISYLNEIHSTEWVAFNGKLVERTISPTHWDIFEEYSIRDLRIYDNLRYGTKENNTHTIVPLATAIRDQMLFVACKETLGSKTIRTIKICNPRPTPNKEEYLESLIDFNLDLFLEGVLGDNQISNEEISSIGFSEKDTTILVVNTTGNRRFFYRIFFDYYYFNPNNNKVYFLEEYKNAKIAIT